MSEIKWNDIEVNQAVKGKKGFGKTEEQRDKKVFARLTKEQFELVRDYCKNTGKTPSALVREALYLYLLQKKVDPNKGKTSNKNQMKMFK